MNSSNSSSQLSLDDTGCSISNMPFDESIEVSNTDYISTEASNELEERLLFKREDINAYNLFPPIPPTKEEEEYLVDEIGERTYNGVFYADSMDMEAAMVEDVKWRKFRQENSNLKFNDKIGDGKMEYIKNINTREMCIDAWQAITLTNNWDFVSQDIESFMWSSDPRIDEITEKMDKLNDHSGSSFGCTMRYMQFLSQNGEKEFKKLFELDNLEENC